MKKFSKQDMNEFNSLHLLTEESRDGINNCYLVNPGEPVETADSFLVFSVSRLPKVPLILDLLQFYLR